MQLSQGDIEIAVRVAQASETLTGQCFRCNKVGHRFHDEECEMYNPEFLNTLGTCKDQQGQMAPRMRSPSQTTRTKGTH